VPDPKRFKLALSIEGRVTDDGDDGDVVISGHVAIGLDGKRIYEARLRDCDSAECKSVIGEIRDAARAAGYPELADELDLSADDDEAADG
jgi:hypothetical protein